MTSWNPDPKRESTGTDTSRPHPALRFVRRHARRLAIASGVTLVLTPLLALNAANAASATPIALAAPPDATHTIPYTYQGQVYYMDANGLTATGANIVDTALDPTFHPAAQGISYGPVQTVLDCLSAPPQGGPVDRATYSDAQFAAYGLPTWADFLDRGNTDRAEWEATVRNSGTRLCNYSSEYENGKPMAADNLSERNAKIAKTAATSTHQATALKPNLSYCYNASTIAKGQWWGWMSDSTGDCPWPTYYQYTSMEGYIKVPNWDNTAFANQDVAGWLGRGGWTTQNACGSAVDRPSLVQAGFQIQTFQWVVGIENAMWDNTGYAADCNQNVIRYSSDANSTPWSLNGGDLLQILQGCGISVPNCTYTYIGDTTQGSSNHYFQMYVPGPAPDERSAACMYELTHDHDVPLNTTYSVAFYDPTYIDYCRASHWDGIAGHAAVEQGVANYDAFELATTDRNNDGGFCGYPGTPTNPSDPTWPNSTFIQYRDNNDFFYC
jgi:hypothetical protein